MNHCLIFKNPTVYDNDLTPHTLKYLVAENGRISYMGDAAPAVEGEVVDCSGKTVLKPFCDHHYHLPGSMLYDLFGVNLCEYGVSEYADAFAAVSRELKAVRGFGWEVHAMKRYFSSSGKTPQELLDEAFPHRPAVIFSLDFHSCWCNSLALAQLKAEGVALGFADREIPGGEDCIFHEAAVEDIFKSPVLGFCTGEIESAILAEQKRLLARGISEVFSLVFIGASYFTVLEVLKAMDQRGLIRLKIHFSYTVFPDVTAEAFRENVAKSLTYQSERLIFAGVKLYADGVIDNHSAVLLRPYEDGAECGRPMWENDALARVLALAEESGLAVHIHAIGDGAVAQAAKALATCKPPRVGRHMIAHLQLCASEAVALMAEHGIAACMQPFWFYRGAKALHVDKQRLGARVEEMYPVRSLMARGVKVLFSSDCPATADCDPLVGMRVASRLESGEQISLQAAYGAYYAGAYTDEGVALKQGDPATFILLDKDLFEKPNARVVSVYLNGEYVLA